MNGEEETSKKKKERKSTKLRPELRVYQLTAHVILHGFKI